jgi:hypothetical protein
MAKRVRRKRRQSNANPKVSSPWLLWLIGIGIVIYIVSILLLYIVPIMFAAVTAGLAWGATKAGKVKNLPAGLGVAAAVCCVLTFTTFNGRRTELRAIGKQQTAQRLLEETAERQQTAKEEARQPEAERVEQASLAKVEAKRAEASKEHTIKIVLPEGATLEVYSSNGERVAGSDYSETTDGNINLVRGKYKAKVTLVDLAGSIRSGSRWFTVPARKSVRVPFTETITFRPKQPVYEQPAASSTTSDSEVYFANCSAARAAGAAPIMEGQPGYRSRLDRDSDGIACE